MKKLFVIAILLLLLGRIFPQPKDEGSIWDFRVRMSTFDAHLKWNPDVSKDGGHFEVERSLDGQHFELLDCINPQSKSPHEYHFTDANVRFLVDPVVYYRIRWINENGGSQTGPVAALSIDPHYLR